MMKTPTQVLRIASTLAVVAALSACGSMTAQEENTAIGAGVGAVAGSVLTGGNAAGTVGGAVVGGVIGNKVKR
jgi:osmotically inducible lipoprotein OsmB